MDSNAKFTTVFVLLRITLYGGLSFAVWNLHTQSVTENQNQNTELQTLKYENENHISELQSLKSANENLQNQITKLQDIVQAINPNLHSSDETIKRLTRQSGSSQSSTDDAALAELIEKKLYTIMDCARDGANNLTNCSLKPGPKGDKGCLGDEGKEGNQGKIGEPGIKGHIGYPGYPGHKGEEGPKILLAIPAKDNEGLKEIWVHQVERGLKASKVRKDSLDSRV